MPFLKELSRTSRDSFESDSESKESLDVWLNSFKSGILRFVGSIDLIFISIRSILRPSVVVDRLGKDREGGEEEEPVERSVEDVDWLTMLKQRDSSKESSKDAPWRTSCRTT